MKLKTAELQGTTLDWAVAKCEHPEWTERMTPANAAFVSRYSTDWSQGGPIIEREKIAFAPANDTDWHAWRQVAKDPVRAPTPLIAAMRCYCCAKLGDEVEIPEELCQPR